MDTLTIHFCSATNVLTNVSTAVAVDFQYSGRCANSKPVGRLGGGGWLSSLKLGSSCRFACCTLLPRNQGEKECTSVISGMQRVLNPIPLLYT